MTIRSLVIGVLLATLLCAFCYFCDYVVRPGSLMVSSLLPAVAYGGLVFYVLLVNPLLRRVNAKLALGGREVAVVLALFLIACGVPGWSFGQVFPCTVMFPHYDERVNPSWKELEILKLAPPQMLCDVDGPNGELGLNGYITGMGKGNDHINPMEIPWSVWKRPFLFWGPIVFSFFIAVFGLAAVFHQQWSAHEQLPYPIVQFASSLLPGPDGKMAPMLHNRLFYIGFLFIFLILLNNYLCRWQSDIFIPVKLDLALEPLRTLFPTVVRGKGDMLFHPLILPAVVGLAYFLPSEASFSMWFGPWLYCFISGIFAIYGVEVRAGKMMALVMEPFIFAGGYFGLLLIILYTGRQYYLSVLKHAVGLKGQEKNVPPYAVMGMRLFLVGTVAFILLLNHAGLHWSVGILYTVLAIMVYTVVSRVLAETGAFEIGTFVYPCVFLWGVLGASALGPRPLVIMFLTSTVLLAAPGWSVMPFINQAMKLTEGRQVPLARTFRWGMAVMILAVLVAIPCTIYWQYDQGAMVNHWPRSSSYYPFANAVEAVLKLKAQGMEETAMGRHGFQHLLQMAPDRMLVMTFLITVAITLLVAFGRLKYTWWPLHPVIFIFFGGHQGMYMSLSFGIGFLLKWLVTKYGGGAMYQKCKPLMVGVIAGTVCGQFTPMIFSTLYYLTTGKTIN